MDKPWIHEVYESADTICERVYIRHGGKDVVVAWWSTGCHVDNCPSTVVFDPELLSDEELADLYEAAFFRAKENRDKVLAGKVLDDNDTVVGDEP